MAHSELFVGDLTTPTFHFTDSDLLRANGELSVDIVGNRLAQDEIELTVSWDAIGENIQVFAPADFDAILGADDLFFATNYTGTEDLTTIPYGTPVWYYFDSALVGKFHTKRIIQTGVNTYEIQLMSAVGLLSNLIDRGGMYKVANNDTFLSVLAQILEGTAGALDNGVYPITGGVFNCLVEQQAAVQPIEGHLPYGQKRENLHALMFSESVTLTKASDGTPLFTFLYNQQAPAALDSSKIYLNGRVNYGDAATAVEVTEHTFLDLGTTDELVTLFDGAAEGTVTNALVLFDDPIHGDENGDLIASGVTVHEWGANYAIISGSGTLQGYKYTHSQKTVRRDVENPTGEPNEISVRDVELISPLNSANVADRLLAYYSAARTVDLDVVRSGDEPRVGRQYSFADPFGGTKTGFVSKMTLAASNIMRAGLNIITDYVPTGGGNNFANATLFTSGNITVPDGVTKMRLILIAGGSGGSAGSNGADGGRATLTNYSGGYWRGYDDSTATGGAGGAGGNGGAAGKILTVDLDPVTPGDTITVSYGIGGAAGATGSDTTIAYNGTTYSTANGAIMPNGIVNLFTGAILATSGKTGIPGASGGKGSGKASGTGGTSGGSVTEGATTYPGGSGAATTATDSSHYRVYGDGAAGGGAAYGRAGGVGRPQYSTDYHCNGGDGADAVAPPQADFGCGGRGGSGGGGGGGGGISYFYLEPSYNAGAGGSGGSGSAGGQGGNGAVLAYY